MIAAYKSRASASGWAHDLSLLCIRVGLAAVFIFHGGQKLFGWFGGKGILGLIEHLGVIMAYLVAIGEFFGGVGLLLGILSRFSAASLALIMAGAIFMVHGKNGFASA
jgi:putative oxidoreductase